MTPAIEPLSLDEAFLDLTGTRRLHGHPPAVMLARLTRRMETELGLTGSVGAARGTAPGMDVITRTGRPARTSA